LWSVTLQHAPEDYKKWLKEKSTFKEELKAAAASASKETVSKDKDTTVLASDKMMAQEEKK
jgi:heme/copper-type cytochrome/quinol oxidase subunit 2